MHGVWRLPTRSTQDRCEGCPTPPAWRSLRHPVGPHGIIAPEGGHLSSRASGNLCHHACFLSEFVFLPPFAPTAFTAFFATMAALTAAPDGDIPSLSRSSSPCLTSRHLPDIPTPTIQHRTGVAFQLAPFQRAGLPVPELSCRTQALFGTRVRASSHARRLASMFDRITFVSFGLSVRLPLLPTPPRGDAVTVGYMLEPKHAEDLHLSGDMRSQAH